MQTNNRRLYRSRQERMITGICGGLAQFLGMDPSIMRLGVVLIAFLWPPTLLVYLALLLSIPEEPLSQPESPAPIEQA
jgi:phage shock protein C